MLQNPFFIIRYTCFSLILFLNALTLFFAAWNVAVMKSVGQAAPGASVFLLFNACVLFLFIAISFLELVVAKAKTTMVKFECGWTATLAILQLAGALTVTATGPPTLCRSGGSSASCISMSVLIPLSWLSSFTTIVYFLTLTITTIVYRPYHGNIWSSSVYAVPWFTLRDPPPLYHKSSSSTSSRSAERSNGIWDEEPKDEEEGGPAASRSCLSLVAAPWARGFQNRRGLDRPFATRSQVMAANPGIPAPPPKSYPPPIAARYLGLSHPLPSEVDNSRPALTRSATLSQWIREDAANGRTVHTRPPISPR